MLKVNVAGKMTPTDSLVPLAVVMACVAGACEYKLDGSHDWMTSKAGEKFSVPGNSKFEIRVTAPYHYICHFG